MITADSTPDYDDWGPDDYWSCNDWITWHKALVVKYGKAEADKRWQEAWDKQDSFEHDYNWCKYDGVFNAYVRQNSLNASWWLPNILNDTTGGISGVIENASDTAVNTTKILKWLIPSLVIIAAIIMLFWAYKTLKNV